MGGACHQNGKMPHASPFGISALRFKFAPCNTALTDDGLEGAQSNFVMIGGRDGHGSINGSALHDDMAALTPSFCRPMLR
jgi:hypothetical protein